MRAAIAILMTCALVLAPASAVAEEHADDRSYDVTVSEDRAEIQMPRQVAERTAETGVIFDTREGQLSGSFGFADAEATDERLDVRLHQLVEFEDADDDGELDDEDEIRSAWRLSNASRNVTMDANGTVEWQALETTNVTSEDGVEGTRVQAVGEFPEQDPLAGVISQLGQGDNRTVTMNLTVFDEPAQIDGTQVPAHHVHVDWTVDNYPYTAEDTQLALVAGAVGTSELSVADHANATEIANRATVDGFTADVAANVSDHATVDGNETTVATSGYDAGNETEDEGDERLVALGYERGTVVQHSLVVGSSVQTSDESMVDAANDKVTSVPSVGAVAALGLMGLAAVVYRRR